MHNDSNGYGTPDTISALQAMATHFADNMSAQGVPASGVPLIRITAMSLPFGGLFDFQAEWAPPHRGHRFGTEADLGMAGLTVKQKAALADALDGAGFRTPVWSESSADPSANHWHIQTW